ncbi:hypothetical protein NQ314_012685 [Rhamnusium bicolor]|uniref:Reverse transcriptase domain-containing protein n=1 Tax=Rhamnusium bicolor TaxID=1586634 RepID=A0AAV8XB30_9CUCU|nr:hypothetical protein NQ314_012685 [Rhamnusium bicolor]
MLQHMGTLAKTYLLGIFNDILVYSDIPEPLKKSVVTLIPKPGKDLADGDSHRPITLMSCITKTLERMIKFRLEYWLLKNNLLPDNQYGYKPGSGTTEATTHLVTDIQNSLTDNQCTAVVFIDIKNAYNNIDLKILSEKLQVINIPGRIIQVDGATDFGLYSSISIVIILGRDTDISCLQFVIFG